MEKNIYILLTYNVHNDKIYINYCQRLFWLLINGKESVIDTENNSIVSIHNYYSKASGKWGKNH